MVAAALSVVAALVLVVLLHAQSHPVLEVADVFTAAVFVFVLAVVVPVSTVCVVEVVLAVASVVVDVSVLQPSNSTKQDAVIKVLRNIFSPFVSVMLIHYSLSGKCV